MRVLDSGYEGIRYSIRGMTVLDSGYEGIGVQGMRVLDPGYEGIRSRVLDIDPRYEGIRFRVCGYYWRNNEDISAGINSLRNGTSD